MNCSIQQTVVAIHELPLQCGVVHVYQVHQICTEIRAQRM